MSKVSDAVFIYQNGDGQPARVIQAKNITAAYKFATGNPLPIKPATARELLAAQKAGVTVEVAPA